MLWLPSGGLELLIPEAVSLGRASEDEYNPTLDDENIGGGVKALPGVILTRPTGSSGQELPPVIWRWSKCVQSLGECFPVSQPLETPDAVLMERRLYCRALLYQAPCPV